MKVYCPYCGKEAELIDSSVIYGRSYGMAYICFDCDAYVGTHKGTEKPLGRLANAELRKWKMRAHDAFDPIWKSRKMSVRKRGIFKQSCTNSMQIVLLSSDSMTLRR